MDSNSFGLNTILFRIVFLLFHIIFSQSCRCTRDFEDENTFARSYVVIDIKPGDDDSLIDLISSSSSDYDLVISRNGRKATLYIDLDPGLTYKFVKLKKKNGDEICISVDYSVRNSLVSVNKGAIPEYKVLQIDCTTCERSSLENKDWLCSVEKSTPADAQIFL